MQQECKGGLDLTQKDVARSSAEELFINPKSKSPNPRRLSFIKAHVGKFAAAVRRWRCGGEPLTYPLSIDFAPLIGADGKTKSLVI